MMEMVKIRIFITGSFMAPTYDTEVSKDRFESLINLLNNDEYTNKFVKIGGVVLKPETVERIIVL